MDERQIKLAVAQAVSNCGECAARLEESSVSVLGHHENLWFLSITCARCRSRSLVSALVQESVIPSLKLTDLTAEELARFDNAPRVAADDVLDIHQFLDHFDGDFRTLFDD
jgi:hypothetical protein